MATKKFDVKINGYWREPDISSIPAQSGVYFVYECTFNREKKTVSLHKLIYIGESENVRNRIKNHEKWDDWKKHVREDNQLCFSFGTVPSADRDRVEAAYIFKHKPPENTEYVISFPFDQTTVNSTGTTALLVTNFTVYRS